MAIDIGQIKLNTPVSPPSKPVVERPEVVKVATERTLLEEERIYRRGVVTVRDLISPAAFEVTPKYLRLSGLYVRTIFIVTYPLKAEIILKQLQKKVGIFQAKILGDADKGAPRDPLAETALRDIEDLRDALTQGIEHFFQFAFYLTIYGKDMDDLDKFSQQVESLFGSKLIYSKSGFYQTEQGFNSTIPLGNDELMITYNMNTSPIPS